MHAVIPNSIKWSGLYYDSLSQVKTDAPQLFWLIKAAEEAQKDAISLKGIDKSIKQWLPLELIKLMQNIQTHPGTKSRKGYVLVAFLACCAAQNHFFSSKELQKKWNLLGSSEEAHTHCLFRQTQYNTKRNNLPLRLESNSNKEKFYAINWGNISEKSYRYLSDEAKERVEKANPSFFNKIHDSGQWIHPEKKVRLKRKREDSPQDVLSHKKMKSSSLSKKALRGLKPIEMGNKYADLSDDLKNLIDRVCAAYTWVKYLKGAENVKIKSDLIIALCTIYKRRGYYLSVNNLAELMNLSTDTILNYLEKLDMQGRVVKIYHKRVYLPLESELHQVPADYLGSVVAK